MKKLLLVMVMMLIVSGASSIAAAAPLSDFAGTWENVDPNTSGITHLQIDVSQAGALGNGLTLQAWGKCSPTDCDWGAVDALAYADSVGTSVLNLTQAVSAVFTTNFEQTTLIVHLLAKDQLQVEALTQFTDNSGRSNYDMVETFKRSSNQTCIDFTAQQAGTLGPNPLVVQGVSFHIFDFNGTAMQNSEIRSDGNIVALGLRFSTEILLPSTSQTVTITLVHFANPAQVDAFNANGTVASATMSKVQKQPQTLTLTSATSDINRLMVKAPSDETNLLSLCYDNSGQSQS